MLIFGTRWTLVVLGQLLCACSNCQRDTVHSAMVNKGKFTLFFIPLFPIGRKFLIACNVCGLRRQAVGTLFIQLQQWEKTGLFPSVESLAAPPRPIN
jgi:hypothetical protein